MDGIRRAGAEDIRLVWVSEAVIIGSAENSLVGNTNQALREIDWLQAVVLEKRPAVTGVVAMEALNQGSGRRVAGIQAEVALRLVAVVQDQPAVE